MRTGQSGESGFSLVELLVSVVVTLIISGAVYGVVAGGNTGFRREPELSDRQQNIRVAMSLIQTDVLAAGRAMPAFAQTFTDGLDGVGPVGPSGQKADELEIFTSGDCPSLSVCDYHAGSSVTTMEPLGSCYGFPNLVILANEAEWGVFWAEEPGAGSTASCSGGSANNGHVVFAHGQAPLVNPPGGQFGFAPTVVSDIHVARYKIELDAEGVPNLWRSGYGGRDLLTGESSWQLIARGVEDLQVRFENGNGWNNRPGTVTASDYNTIVRRLEVRLSSRVTAANLAGQTRSAVGDAIRGQLVTQITPRAALGILQAGGQWQ